MLDAVEIVTGSGAPQWTILWLHGLGADGHDFEPIVPELVKPSWPAVRFVFPHAPVRAVTINGGMRMRAWYDILGQEIANRQDEHGIRESAAKIDRLIERESLRGVREERIVIAGFSQGGAIALAGAVRHRQRLGGVVALSTYLPVAESTEKERSEANRALPVFMAHGNLDPVVGHALGLMSKGYLENLGYRIDWHSYPMPHSVSAEEISDLAAWLGERFAADGR
jgi:phospholipase/carboxylesterase